MHEAQELGEKLASFRSTLSDDERGLLDRILAAAHQSNEVPEVESFGFGLVLPASVVSAATSATEAAQTQQATPPIPEPSTAQAIRG
jgi:hypothetical protein